MCFVMKNEIVSIKIVSLLKVLYLCNDKPKLVFIMGTSDKTTSYDKSKDSKLLDTIKSKKPRIKFTVVTKEELERRRVPVYSYFL